MKVSVEANEPNILREARPGDLFLVHTVTHAECVCACVQVYAHDELALDTATHPDYCVVVVVGCRVPSDSPLHHYTGRLCVLHRDTPVTFVEQIERTPLRARERFGAQAPPNPDPVSRL